MITRQQVPLPVSLLAGIVIMACAVMSASAQRDARPAKPLFQLLDSADTKVRFGDLYLRMPKDSIDNGALSIMVQSGGIAIGDIDGDTLPDLVMTTYIEGLRIYRNLGDFRFEDVTTTTKVLDYDNSRPTGVTLGDVDGDNDLDLFVTRWNRPNRLYINDGKGHFTDEAPRSRLNLELEAVQGSLFDADSDGDLDLYVVHYGQAMKLMRQLEKMDSTAKAMNEVGQLVPAMLPTYSNDSVFALNTQTGMQNFNNLTGPRNENRHSGEPDLFFLNNGDGTFTESTYQAWLYDKGMGLSCTPGDLNNDGHTDLYITNDFAARDIVYLNNGDATFANKSRDMIDHSAVFSMGSDLADFNNDGLVDIVCVDMYPESHFRRITRMGPSGDFSEYNPDYDSNQVMRNSLQLNRGDGTFSEIAFMAGVVGTDWSWASLFFDADLDGWKDLLIVNGYLYDISDQDYVNNLRGDSQRKMEKMNMLREPTFLFRNNGDLTFADSSKAWGVDAVAASMGAAYGDLDMDGDPDLIVVNIDKPVEIYRNMSREYQRGNYIQFVLDGRPSANTHGVGSRVYVTAGGVTQMQELYPVRGFMSSVEPMLTFGIGTATSIDSAVVYWHGGGKQVLPNPTINMRHVLRRTQASAGRASYAAAPAEPLLKQVNRKNNKFPYTHTENRFDDFKRERLLPTRISWDGPGCAGGDINGDGRDDIYVGGAQGRPGVFMMQQPDGSFTQRLDPVIAADSAYEDLGSLLLDIDNDGDLDLYVASGGIEVEVEDEENQDRLYLNDGKGTYSSATNRLPRMQSNCAAVTAADIDADGDLDIFSGGRIVPGAYPHSPMSCLLRNDGNVFTDITKQAAPELAQAGLVRSAVFSDADNDGRMDLLVATEWGPIKVFRNNGGTFTDVTKAAGLADANGMWCSITPGDIDNDGDMDYVAGNIGWNTRFKRPTPALPIRIHTADFDDNGSLDPIITYIYRGVEWVMRDRATVYGHMPTLQRRYNTYEQFAAAPFELMFDKDIQDTMLTRQVDITSSCLLVNDGKGVFTIRELPNHSQIAPMMGTCVTDLNDDGNLDIITVGNMYGADREIVKYDAGKGLVMLGDGSGGFKPIAAAESGLGIDADTRSMVCVGSVAEGTRHLVVFANQDAAYLYKFRGQGTIVPAKTGGTLTMQNGKTRKFEGTYGGGYLSDQPRWIFKTNAVRSVNAAAGIPVTGGK
ncbi:MAG: hypothetical protein FGM24_00970 [Candidatus Kapabacteria bacterium]|nr:hypothetical protein [Candidatus Kapabacteria bacterium]